MGIINNQGVFIAPPLGEGEGTSLTSFREDDDFSTELFDESIVLADLPNDIGIAFIKSSDSPADYATIALNGDNTSAIYANNTNDEVKGIISGDVYIGYKKGTTTPVANIKGSQPIGDLYVNGDAVVYGTLDGSPTGALLARIQTAESLPVKPFDIPHPSKNNYRLRHVCLEGPEVGVYFRGKIENKKEIELPSYWKDLVNEYSISVQLQPIGTHQNIIIKKIEENKIFLQSIDETPINCFYHVYGERKDVEKLIVEYEGKSKFDYPSNNWKETYPEEFGESLTSN